MLNILNKINTLKVLIGAIFAFWWRWREVQAPHKRKNWCASYFLARYRDRDQTLAWIFLASSYRI